jgi:AraC-like DNA-binding protein
MKPIINLKNISELNAFLKSTTRHPLVAVVDFSKASDSIENETRISSDFYSVMFKNYCVNNIRYGRKPYDFQDGSLICIAPKQVLTIDNEAPKKEDMIGWGVFFHPDLIRGTSLGAKIKEFTFFLYESNEALHLSEKEKTTLHDIVKKIDLELSENIDKHSQTLIVSNIELLLNYCSRYYDRQFITRKRANNDYLVKFENLLNNYFQSPESIKKGLPTVKYCADKLYLTPNYLSDLLKKETGMNTQEHIHNYIIEESKNVLLNSNHSIGEISNELGFEYPQYFSKLFKTKTGMTPIEYRKFNN